MSVTNYGCRVTSENLKFIIAHVADFGLNVDYLEDMLQMYTVEDGIDLYCIFSTNDETNGKTFNEMIEPDFFRNWRFVQDEDTLSPWLQIIDRKL